MRSMSPALRMLLTAWPFNDARAALDLDFRKGRLDPRLTYTGGANGSYVDSTGTLVTGNVANTPRFTYDPTTLACLGLLVEEQRTNLAVRSAEFDNASWIKSNVTVSANAVNGPDGTLSADQMSATAADSNFGQNVTASASTTYTGSIYLRASAPTTLTIFLIDTAGGSGNTSAVCNVTTSWQRFIVTRTTSVGTGGLSLQIGGASSFSTGESVYAWGAQIESGAFATSHIATAGAAVTRTADACSLTGNAFTAPFNPTEGTLAVEAQYVGVTSGAFPRCASFVGSNVNTDTMGISVTGATTAIRAGVTTGGTDVADIALSPVVAANTTFRAVMAYKENDIKASLNGAAVGRDTSATIPTCTSMLIGGATRFQPVWSGPIARLRYWRASANEDSVRRIALS